MMPTALSDAADRSSPAASDRMVPPAWQNEPCSNRCRLCKQGWAVHEQICMTTGATIAELPWHCCACGHVRAVPGVCPRTTAMFSFRRQTSMQLPSVHRLGLRPGQKLCFSGDGVETSQICGFNPHAVGSGCAPAAPLHSRSF
ncbi:hypothetical protein WJX82_006860 [Trebouxia sp. C0006]